MAGAPDASITCPRCFGVLPATRCEFCEGNGRVRVLDPLAEVVLRMADEIEQLRRQGDEINRAARAGGAEHQWVTPDGFTQLPAEMIKELGLLNGGPLWFLRSSSQRWEAWTAAELDQAFGFEPARHTAAGISTARKEGER